MNGLKTIVKRKYLMKILAYIMMLTLLSVMVLSTVLTIESENKIRENQKKSNQKIMNMIDYNISYMSEMINRLQISLYYDSDLYSLLFAKSVDNWDDYDKITKLQTNVSATSFLESIVIYNTFANAFITNKGVLKDPSNPNVKVFKELLSQPYKLSKLHLIPVRVDEKDLHTFFFSSLLYESSGKYKQSESALILNIKPEWLINSIKAINSAVDRGEIKVLILDKDNNIILGGDKADININGIIAQMSKTKGQSLTKWNSVIYGNAKNKIIADLSPLNVNTWRIMLIQPYDDVFGFMYKIRLSFIFIILSFLAIALFFAYRISMKLYKPVDDMVRNIKLGIREKGSGSVDRDELKYVSTMYSTVLDKLGIVKHEQNSKNVILRNYYLKKLITDSSSISRHEYTKMVEDNNFKIGTDSTIVLCIIKIDDFRTYIEKTSPADESLFKFAISNITEEIITSRFPCDMVDIMREHLVLFIKTGDAGYMEYKELRELFRKIQEAVLQYFHISLSIAVSEDIHNYMNITMQYNLCMQFMQYKLVFGRESIITPDMVKKNMNSVGWKLSDDMQKRIIEDIKLSDINKTEKTLWQIFADLKLNNYDCIIQTVLQIFFLIKSTLNEINAYSHKPIQIDVGTLNKKLMELETLDEMCEYLIILNSDFVAQQKEQKDEKNDILVDTIKQLIESNYCDPNFSLTLLSDMLKMSQVYMGRIFKKNDGMTIGEYINELRLNRALELLRDSNSMVKDIMEKVGYINESYFWRLFKKKFGITPKEYRMKITIK